MTPAAVAAINPVTPAPQAGASSHADLQRLASRFNELMLREPDPSIYTEQHLQNSGSPVTAWVRSEERVMNQTFEKMQALSVEAPHLGLYDLTLRQMDMQQQMVMASLQFQSATCIVESGKNGVQTLMKNQ